MLLCQRLRECRRHQTDSDEDYQRTRVPRTNSRCLCRGLAYIHDFECKLGPKTRELFSERQTETEFFHACVEALVADPHRKGGRIEMRACLNLASNLAANLDTSAAAQCMDYLLELGYLRRVHDTDGVQNITLGPFAMTDARSYILHRWPDAKDRSCDWVDGKFFWKDQERDQIL